MFERLCTQTYVDSIIKNSLSILVPKSACQAHLPVAQLLEAALRIRDLAALTAADNSKE